MDHSQRPPSASPPSKHDLLVALLDEGMTMVHLDARVDGVDVPPAFKTDPHLRLNLSRRFGHPLTVHEDRVDAVLTFGGRAYPCVIPFGAVFALISHTTGKTLTWPEDIPPEVLQDLEKAATPPPPPRPRSARSASRPPRPRLTSVPDAPEPEANGAAPVPAPAPAVPAPAPEALPPDGDAPRTPPKRGHLRLVK